MQLLIRTYYLFLLVWGLGIGDWGLPNPQSPIPNPLYLIIEIIIKI